MSERTIHETAIVDAAAELDGGVEIGPRAIVEGGVRIGRDCRIGAGAVIKRGTTLGPDNVVKEYAVLGGDPQHTAYKGAPTFLQVGSGNQIGEFVTFHRAYKEGGATQIGDGNYFMAYSHVGHDCVVGHRCTFTNYAALAGHTIVEDRVLFAGYAAAHQFCRVGTMAMLAGGTLISRDALPYLIYLGSPGRPVSVNLVGLSRAGVSEEARTAIRQAYRILCHSGLALPEAARRLRDELGSIAEVAHMIEFIERSERGIAT